MSRPLRVLLVDDHDHVRRGLRLALEEKGHAVAEADDGSEGLRLARLWQPDVAVVEVDLLIVSGYELAWHVRREFGARVRLVALTGHNQRERALAAGFDSFLLKPTEPERICELVRRAA
jgi:two-component system, sensor histidine kinase